jgi:peroxiredoxin
MRALLIFLIIFFTIASCRNDEKTCHLTGSLKNAPGIKVLYLADLENRILFDSIKVVDGKIDHEFNLDYPKKFYLHNKRNKYPFRDSKSIWLEPSEISVNGDFEFLENLKIEGSSSHSVFEKYTLLLAGATKQIDALKEQIHFKPDDKKKKDSIKIELLQADLSDSIVNFMMKYPGSRVTLSSLHDECYLAFRHLNKKQINQVYENLSEELKLQLPGVEIKKYIELPEPPKVGDMAPEIIQFTPEGDTVRLSDYRGKYVLVDFWDSYCAPCRGSHKWLRRIYNTYNPYGFEILGVSGDSNKNRWITAIEQDSITWTNVSDLKGWKNEAFLVYDVKFIPQNYLVNPEGVIIKHRLNSEFYADHELAQIIKN